MNIFEWHRRRLLEKVVDMSMQYGVLIYYTNPYYSYNDPELKVKVPETDYQRTVEGRHETARRTIQELSSKPLQDVRRAYRRARRSGANLDVQTALYNRVDEEAVSAMRTDAMVTLLRTGREDHPAYVMLAEASTVDEIKSIKQRAERMQLER